MSKDSEAQMGMGHSQGSKKTGQSKIRRIIFYVLTVFEVYTALSNPLPSLLSIIVS